MKNRISIQYHQGITPLMGILIVLISCLVATTTFAATGQSTEKDKAAIAALIRPEVTLAARALGFAMQGKRDAASVGPVVFDNASIIPKTDPVIHREGFQLSQIVTTTHEPSQTDVDLRFASGALIHKDRYGRLIMSNYTVQFRVTQEEKVIIKNASVTPLDPPLPRVHFFYVPASQISLSSLPQYDFTSLLEKVSRDSVPISNTKSLDRSLQDYYVFAFLMDRLSADADAGIALVTGDEKKAGTGNSENSGSSVGSFSFDMKRSVMGSADDTLKSKGSNSLQTDGWHAAWLPAKFALDGKKIETFKVLYTPGSHVPRSQRIQLLIDMYSTNISDTNAAIVRLIQKSLSEQGYNPGPVDGRLTSQTVAAIKKYQTDRKLIVDGKPTASLYEIISGSPQMPIPAEPQKTVASRQAPGQDDTVTVMKLQYWLSQAGYYKGPVDGKMDRETRNAMAAFKKQQQADASKAAAVPTKTVVAKQQTQKTAVTKQPAPQKTAVQKPKKTTAKKKAVSKKPAGKTKKADNSAARFAAFEKAFGNQMWPNGIEPPAEKETSEGYSIAPESMLFIVPAEAVRSQKLPGTYFDLLNFVAQRSVPPARATSAEQDYVAFAFLKDKTSPSAKFELKVSGNKRGIGGYKKGSKSLNFNGRKVSYLAGKMSLLNSEKKSLLYLKAVFTPGDEVGFFSRSSRRVGLYATDGT